MWRIGAIGKGRQDLGIEQELQGQTHETGTAPEPLNASLSLLAGRGLMLAQNKRGNLFREKELHRWAAYSARVFQCTKIDVLVTGKIPHSILTTLRYLREFDCALSLRTDCSAAPEGLETLAQEGLEDVFLCPKSLDDTFLDLWLKTCHELMLPVRLQLQVPFTLPADLSAWGEKWRTHGVRVVNVTVADFFQPITPCNSEETAKASIEFCNQAALHLTECGIEVNIIGFPPMSLSEAARPYAMNARILFQDHQHYCPQAYLMAQQFYSMRVHKARTLLLLELKRHTVGFSPTDRGLTLFLFVWANPLYAFTLLLAKLWRTWRATPLSRRMLEETGVVFEAMPSLNLSQEELKLASRVLGRWIASVPPCPIVPNRSRPRYISQRDERLLHQYAYRKELAREAQEWERQAAPTRICDHEQWGTEEAFLVPEYGASGWLTFLSGERCSTQIDIVTPPFMASLTVGGGLAEAVGFRLSRSCKIMCPLVEARHAITLYAGENGRYVLLRDGQPVQPLHRRGEYPPPIRVPSLITLHVAVWDIDERIAFSPLKLWKKERPSQPALPAPKYSVIVFCTRFARRLAASLQCLVHQNDFDRSALEVIVGYVPGLDAAEDVLESLHLAFPDLRIVHAPFPRQNVNSKGFVLNQCMSLATGERIVLLDADTLLPPWMFASLEQLDMQQHPFIFPQGRAMLDRETTANILLGQIKPWENWDALLASTTGIRENEAKGMPIGYCQCFSRSCTEQVHYPEYEHFQGADYEFAMKLRKYFGAEHRLDFPVLHLDHWGSQWFGSERHF